MLRQPSIDQEALISESQRVECWYSDGKERMSFPSISEAARFFKVTKTEILDCCYGERKSLKKRKWRVVEDDEANDAVEAAQRFTVDDYFNTQANLPVECWSLDNKSILHAFASANEAAIQLFIKNVRVILDCCHGKRVSAFGFRFNFRSRDVPNKSENLLNLNQLLSLRVPPIHDLAAAGSLASLCLGQSAIDCYNADGNHFLRRFATLDEVQQELNISNPFELEECLDGLLSTAYGLW